MFRAKLAGSLLLAFIGVGSVIYINLADSTLNRERAQVEARLNTAEKAVSKSRQLSAHAALAKAHQVAQWPPMARILTRTPESFAGEDGIAPSAGEVMLQVHRQMNEEIFVWTARFKALADGKIDATANLHDLLQARPDYFAVVDAAGIGVARVGDVAWYGPEVANLATAHPGLLNASARGAAFLDVWQVSNAPMLVAVAPVRQGERAVGAVVLGYQLTESEAKADKAAVAADVAYFVGGRIQRSSSLSPKRERELAEQVSTAGLLKSTGRGSQTVTLGGTRHLVRVGRMSGFQSAQDIGFLVLADLDGAIAQAQAPLSIILVACGLGFVLCLGLAMFFFQQFVKPFERMDQGVMELISGNRDHWFELRGKGLSSTMGQNLNILVCILTGRPLPDDEAGSELAAAMQRIERNSAGLQPVRPPEGDEHG